MATIVVRKTLILKSTVRHYGSPWTDADADYVVFDSGKVAGRIMLHPQSTEWSAVVLGYHGAREAALGSQSRPLGDPRASDDAVQIAVAKIAATLKNY